MESALDRFAKERGSTLLGSIDLVRQGRLMTIIGSGILGLGCVFALLPATGIPAEVAYGAVGPALAGLTNIGIGVGMRAAAKRRRVDVSLTPEAAALLRALVLRAQVWQGGWQGRRSRMNGPYVGMGATATVPPSEAAMDALERAARAHNRVSDALGKAEDERSARLRAAADAGMGEALHLAATHREDVEGIDRVVVRLDELAGLVERSNDGPSATSALRSNLEATLEELRAEDQARQELRG